MAIDQQRFGRFVAALRKEKEWTQKQLAEQIGVSDKAVSKWERGLSLPDIGLLEPLAGALGVTVAELLHGERLAEPLPPQAVEALVTDAVRLGRAGFCADPGRRLRWIGLVAAGLLVLGGELLAAARLGGQPMDSLFVGRQGLAPLLAAGMALMLSFLPDTLPAYYDQYKVDSISYGPIRLHLPGVQFNNRNWPYVKRAGLTAMLVLVVGFFPLQLGVEAAFPTLPAAARLALSLGAVLGGLFVPMMVAAVRHGGTPGAGRTAAVHAAAVAAMVCAALLTVGSLGAAGSGFRLNYWEQKGAAGWQARYDGFSGRRSGRLRGEGPLELTVETEAGALTVTVTDEAGRTLLQQTARTDAAWQLADPGPVRVTVEGEEHRGGFTVSYKQPGGQSAGGG